MKRSLQIFILLLAPFFTYCQSFEASLSSDSILLGNYVKLSFKAEDIDGTFESPEISQLIIRSGPNISQSVQIINGKSNSSRKWTYMVEPSETGEVVIPPAFLVTEEETYETEPLYINVYPNPDGIITPPQEESDFSFFDGFDMPFNNRKVPKKIEKENKKSKRKLKRL